MAELPISMSPWGDDLPITPAKRTLDQFQTPNTLNTQQPKTSIYAAGCNAWNNLLLKPHETLQTSDHPEPADLNPFTLVAEGNSISHLRAFLSWTHCTIDEQKIAAGSAPNLESQKSLLSGTQNGRGELLINRLDGQEVLLEVWPSAAHFHFGDRRHSRALCPQSQGGAKGGRITQAAAWETGFIMMDEARGVYTMGDPRFPRCLGRDVEFQPADEPFLVDTLPSPVDMTKKVVAGGYSVGALTEGGHLYAWGMKSPGSASQRQAINGLEKWPNYQQIGDDEDVADVAFGDTHAIALTVNGDVYVIGNNKNWQLGLGWQNREKRADVWTKVELNLGDYWVVGVAAGPQSSFLITRLREDAQTDGDTDIIGT